MDAPDQDRVLTVIARTRHKMIQAELAEADTRGWKFIELRLDFLAKAVDFKRLKEYKKAPWVCTFRRVTDGGRNPCKEDERLAVLRQAIVSGVFEWVDVETDVADAIRRFGKVKRIVSYHNMTETPPDLDDIYDRMLRQDADVYKLAVMANSPSDLEAVFRIQKRAKKPTVAFSMGELGFVTRFTALKYGAPWIYAAFNSERGIAPGLPSCDDFKKTYPVRSITADTQVFGVVGDPVSHSLSPVLHNHMYLRTKTNALYVPLRVPKGSLGEAIKAFDSLPVQGYSVTIPHKEDAAAVAQEAEPFVRLASSANTLVRRANGTFFAMNTDFSAALDAIRASLATYYVDSPPPELSQLSVLILGSGGVARGIAHGLHREGAHLTIAARSMDKAEKLATEVHCRVVDWAGRHTAPYDIVINCTPVGMHPNVDETPFHRSALVPERTVFDTVYTPENTMLIRDAKDCGCRIITGVDMFVRQAAIQFEQFTGVTPDVEKMRQILRKAMSPIRRAMEDENDEARGERVDASPPDAHPDAPPDAPNGPDHDDD